MTPIANGPAAAPEEDDNTMIDLNPKKLKSGDNIFMDFMALYSRASVDDKRTKKGAKRDQKLEAVQMK